MPNFHPRRESRAANLTAYFYWNRELSRVDLPDGQSIGVGYNLVVWNQGPATAQDVRVEVLAPSGDAVELATVETGEFPLRRIDATGRYPIQFAPVSAQLRSGDKLPVIRRFDVRLTWVDGKLTAPARYRCAGAKRRSSPRSRMMRRANHVT